MAPKSHEDEGNRNQYLANIFKACEILFIGKVKSMDYQNIEEEDRTMETIL